MISSFIDLHTANVYGIYGHLGGGKTLTAVEIMLDFLQRHFQVVSNIQLTRFPVDVNKDDYSYIDDLEAVDFWSLPCGAPRGSSSPYRTGIFIDEAAEFYDQYSSGKSPQLTKFLSWLRHSSKRGQFVFLIVQRPEFIAKPLRLLINRWILCDDLAQFRFPIIRLRLPFFSGYVRRIVLDRHGQQISRGLNLGDKLEIGYYYNTAQSIALEGRANDYHETYEPRSALHPLLLFSGLAYIIFILWYV